MQLGITICVKVADYILLMASAAEAQGRDIDPNMDGKLTFLDVFSFGNTWELMIAKILYKSYTFIVTYVHLVSF